MPDDVIAAQHAALLNIAGRELELRYTRGESYDRRWHTRLPGVAGGCGGDLWAPVGTPGELLAAYRDQPDDEALHRAATTPSSWTDHHVREPARSR